MAHEVQGAQNAEEQERRRRPWFLLPWMLLVFLILFCCGQLALISSLPSSGEDTRSALRADYQPWAFLPMAPIDPDLLFQALRDLGLDGTPIATADVCLLPGQNCDGTPTGNAATPTNAPGTPGTPTITPTVTPTPWVPTNTSTNEPPTYTPTVTKTPTVTNTPTQTPTPTPLVYPVKMASPSSIPPGAASVDFTIMVINYGNPTGAQLTRVIDTLPPEMSPRAGSCNPAGCSMAGGVVEWNGSWTIPQGTFRTFRFTADVAGTTGGEVLVNLVEAEGSNFTLAQNNRRVTVQTPTPTATPVSVPVAGDDAYPGTEDTVLSVPAPGLLANDVDGNGDPLGVQPTPVSGPAHGAVALSADGSFSYTPAADYYGVDTFVYRVCDATMLCDTATVTITLTGTPDDPIAVNDAYTLNEDGVLNVASPGLRANDRDPDDLVAPLWDTLAAYLETGPAHQDGAIPFILNALGSFVYTPADNWNGVDTFTYQVCDAGVNGVPEGPTPPSDDRCDGAVVTLTVRSVNDAPEGEAHGVLTDEDVAYVFLVADFPFTDANDTPPNGLSAVVISTTPASGTLTLSGVPVGAGASIPVASITAGNFRYVPPLNGNGSPFTTFTFRVRDNGGTLFGGVDADPSPATQTVNVTAVNDAPVAVADAWQLNPVYIVGQGGSMVVPPPPPDPTGVLLNDTDVDDLVADLTATLVGAGPAEHSGSPFVLDPEGSFTYEPDPAFHGADTFTYNACDLEPLCSVAPATVTLLVDDPPVAQPDAFTLMEDTALAPPPPLDVLGDNGSGPDTDANGDAITVQLIAAPIHASVFGLNADGSFAYTPALNYNGIDTFQYRPFDGWLYGNTVAVTLTITPQNDWPVANMDTARTPEDTPVVIAVLANDTDVEGGPLRVAGFVSGAGHGFLSHDGTLVTYDPVAGYIGNDFFEYQVCDPGADLVPGNGDDLCDSAQVNVVVNGPPSGVDNAYSLSEDTTRNVAAPGVLGNDTDPNGDPLTAALWAGPTHASLFTLNANGSFSYRPTLDYVGGDSFTYDVCDPDVCDATPPTTVTLTITPVQDPPIAVDDGSSLTPLAASEDTPLDVLVLANDSDPDGDPLSIVGVDDPPNGDAVIDNNGTPGNPTDDFITYTPDPDFNGDDEFDYTISANGGTDTATIYITVMPENDPPNAVDNWYLTAVGVEVDRPAPGLLGNDTEPDGQPMTAVHDPLPLGTDTPPSHGTVIVNANGSFIYTPDPLYHGPDTFTYQACDDTLPVPLCDTATVFISMNAAPQTVGDSYSVPEDGSLVVPAGTGVLANDTDPEGDLPLTASLVVSSPPDPPSGPFHGSITFNADGSFTYTPDPNYSGPDDFEYRACDTLGACGIETVTLTVTPVNDPPVAGPDGPYDANEDTLLVVSAPGLLLNDTDPIEGAPVTAETVSGTSVQGGSYSVAADGSFTYTPAAGYFGSDSFAYRAYDGTDYSIPATVTIHVNGVPIAVDDGYSATEDVSLVIAAPGLLTNDSDPNGDPLSVLPVPITAPAHGNVVLNTDGSFTYTPNPNYNGPDAFEYAITDGQMDSAPATVSLLVAAVNDPPTAVGDGAVINWDAVIPVSIHVLDNDYDIDLGDTVLLDGLVTSPAGTLTVNDNLTPGNTSDDYYEYLPDPLLCPAPAQDVFTYRISDGHSAFATAFVTVTVNCPPAAGADGPYTTNEDTPLVVAAPGVLSNDSDPNGDPLTANQVTGPGYGPTNGAVTLNADGSFTYTPNPNYFSPPSTPDTFTYRACDPGGLCSAEITVSMDVVSVNDPPVAGDDGPYGTDEDMPLAVAAAAGLLLNDSDPVELSPVTVQAASGTTAQGGSFSVAADGSFNYTPAADYFSPPGSPDTFTYRITDGTDLSAPATVSISVASVNDAPVAVDDSRSTNQVTPVVVNALGNDYDVDLGDAIVPASATCTASCAQVVANGDGTFTYSPAAGQYGTDSFDYTVQDGFGATSTPATVTISINEPVLHVIKEALPESGSLGDTIDFLIYIWNDGPGTAYGADLEDTLGSCFSFVTPAPDGSLGDIAEGGAVVRAASAQIVSDTACGNTNTARLTAANASTVTDSVTVSIAGMGGTGGPMMMMLAGPLPEEPAPAPESPTEPTPTDAASEPTLAAPTETPIGATEPPAPDPIETLVPEPTAPPEPAPEAEPTPTPLVVSQGSLMADPGNPLAWVILTLFGIWFGRLLVFKVRVPATRTRREARYDEPATRPCRGR